MAARPRPALVDDLIIEILLRLTPDDTACLARASLVCKTLRRLLVDRAFLSRYREVHGVAPILGFFYNNYSTGASYPLFPRTTQPSPFPSPASASSPTFCRTIDCRHGRVLLSHSGDYPSRLTVWEPITGKERCFSAPGHPYSQHTVAAAVLCASIGCDHIGCSAGPFLVVLMENSHRMDWELDLTWPVAQTCLYSSETRNWSVCASIDFDSFTWTNTPSLLAGDTVFFLVISGGSQRILKYDLTRVVLSPTQHLENMILCTAEDGGLGVASVLGSSLCLLSGRSDPDGITRWVQDRAIELDSMIPSSVGGTSTKFYVVGFAEGTGYVFIRANNNIFSVEITSHGISKIGSGKLGSIFPLMGFYIPDTPSARLKVPKKIE